MALQSAIILSAIVLAVAVFAQRLRGVIAGRGVCRHTQLNPHSPNGFGCYLLESRVFTEDAAVDPLTNHGAALPVLGMSSNRQ